MADENSGRAPRAGSMSYGMGPVVTAGVLSLGLLGAGLFGGGAMLQQMAQGPQQQPPAATSTPEPGQDQDPTDDGTKSSTDPSTEPGESPGQTPGEVDPTDGPTGEPTAPGDGSSTDPGTGSDENGDDINDDQPTAPPGHPGDPGDWTYNDQGDVLHTVERGETLSKISSQYGVSVDQLAWYNGIQDINLIYADSVLRVPVLAIPGPEDLKNYEKQMKSGD